LENPTGQRSGWRPEEHSKSDGEFEINNKPTFCPENFPQFTYFWRTFLKNVLY
jgi:hypothetical protein